MSKLECNSEEEQEMVQNVFMDKLGNGFRAVITHPTYALPFLQPGRLVTVKHGDQDFDWGVVVNFSQRTAPKTKSAAAAFDAIPPQEKYVVD